MSPIHHVAGRDPESGSNSASKRAGEGNRTPDLRITSAIRGDSLTCMFAAKWVVTWAFALPGSFVVFARFRVRCGPNAAQGRPL